MPRTYGIIIDSTPGSVTRAIPHSDGSVTVQILRKQEEITLAPGMLADLVSVMQQDTPTPDTILQMLMATTTPEGN